MDHAAFQSWLDRYIDAWRLLDPVAIGDLFSSDVRYAFDPFDEAVVGRTAVVDSWLADPDEPGSWEADYEVLAIDGDALRRPWPDPLPDRRPSAPSTANSRTSSSAASMPRAAVASSPSGTCGGRPEALPD